MGNLMIFEATVTSRSSRKKSGPPGESEVLALNPQRTKAILKATGWNTLAPGTLNLKVEAEVVHALLLHAPAITEPADSIVYPAEYAHIPKMRRGYLYYHAKLSYGGKSEWGLVRRACNPLQRRVKYLPPYLSRRNCI